MATLPLHGKPPLSGCGILAPHLTYLDIAMAKLSQCGIPGVGMGILRPKNPAAMATSSVHTLIKNMLDEAAEKLADELKVLQPQMAATGDGMFIAHNGIDSLIVYTSLAFKAYIPKRYNEWPVTFVEWKGDETEIDIDIPIDVTG